MTLASYRHAFLWFVIATFVSGCGLIKKSRDDSSDGDKPNLVDPATPIPAPVPSPKPVQGPGSVATTLTATFVIATDEVTVTDTQMLDVLKDQCVSCHSPEQPTRMNLTVLPTAADWHEILDRIQREVNAPGYMPLGSAMEKEDQARIENWISQQKAKDTKLLHDAKVTAVVGDKTIAGKYLGSGRFGFALGTYAVGKPLKLKVLAVLASEKEISQTIAIKSLPANGQIKKEISFDEGLLTKDPVDPVEPLDPVDPIDPVEPEKIASFLDVQLSLPGEARVADEVAGEILTRNCKSCHNDGNEPRWDLTTLPPVEMQGEIGHRVNLGRNEEGRMPVANAMNSDDLGMLNKWLKEQRTPVAGLNGYEVKGTDASGNTLDTSAIENGRVRIKLGDHIVGAELTAKVSITGLDGIPTETSFALVNPESGVSNKTLEVPARDNLAPVVDDTNLMLTDLTSAGLTITANAATDDRPAEHLTYQLYRTGSDQHGSLNTIDEISRNGDMIGTASPADGQVRFSVSELNTSAEYVFNVVVSDRTGNKSLYNSKKVLTLPAVLCNELSEAGSLQSWRNDLARKLDNGDIRENAAAEQIARCFPEKVPHCVDRTLKYAERNDVAPSGSDGTIATMPEKRPPDEILDTVAGDGSYWIPDNIEEIAEEKGWTAVRYKSRHAGGFDSDTPNLLMVYVPGDKVDPPVPFDRWLNFPLPIDDDEPVMGTPQNPRPKFGPPSYAAYDEPNSFPSTFTMMSQTRATEDKPATLYFQMFFRGSGPSFTPGGAVGVRGCVSCHPNGLRAIAPLGYDLRPGEMRLNERDWKAVELINKKMVEGAGFKAALWGEGQVNGETKPLYRPDRGPVMGALKPLNSISRTKEFIMGGTVNGQTLEGCFNRTSVMRIRDIFRRAPGMYEPHNTFRLSENPDINPDKVIAAMSCEGCHVKGQRWPLNEDTGRDQVRFKILVDQSMPLGYHKNPLDHGNDTGEVIDRLTPDERFALTNCLEAEFELERRMKYEWMTQESCE